MGGPVEGGRPCQDVNNARCRLGEASVRVMINAEEVRVQNMTERANIPFTPEMKFCLRCHVLLQEGDVAANNAQLYYYDAIYLFFAFSIPGNEPERCVTFSTFNISIITIATNPQSPRANP